MYCVIFDIRVYDVLFLFVFFPWGIPPLQSDWSMSCDHGLDHANYCEYNNNNHNNNSNNNNNNNNIYMGEEGVYGGMYPEHLLRDEGEQFANPVSTTKEQRGPTVHFLDMDTLQSTPGVSQIRVYDKRDHMATLKQYRRYPHIETRL